MEAHPSFYVLFRLGSSSREMNFTKLVAVEKAPMVARIRAEVLMAKAPFVCFCPYLMLLLVL